MSQAREAATATLLRDGTVLVTGGLYTTAPSGNTTLLNSAEIYNPVTNSFGPASSMTTARAYHTATLLPNGNVLIAGAENTAEVYHADTGMFLATNNAPNFERAAGTATLLPNGKVLLAGGFGVTTGDTNPSDFRALSSTDLYDPATNSFEAVSATPVLSTARQNQTATLLPNGKVLFAGGFTSTSNQAFALQSTELYDPVSNTITQGPNMNIGRYQAGAAIYEGTKVLIAGGFISSSTPGTFVRPRPGKYTTPPPTRSKLRRRR